MALGFGLDDVLERLEKTTDPPRSLALICQQSSISNSVLGFGFHHCQNLFPQPFDLETTRAFIIIMANYLASIFGTEQDKVRSPSSTIFPYPTKKSSPINPPSDRSTAPSTTKSAPAATAIAARASTSSPPTRRRSCCRTCTRTRRTTPRTR